MTKLTWCCILIFAVTLVSGTSAATKSVDELEIHHPDFHARVGMTLYAQVGKQVSEQSLKATLKGPAATTVVCDRKAPLGEREPIVIDFRKLPKGDYTLTVQLVTGGQVVREAVRTFEKPYDGVPRVGIDENNAICIEGKPFFPVMCKGVSQEKDVVKWKPYVNTMKHIGFDPKLYTPQGFKTWLDRAHKHGLMAVGPGRGFYWPNGGGIYKSKTQRDRQCLPEQQKKYIEVARRHPAFLMYEWKDEPELDNESNCIYPKEVRRWVDMCHELDKEHLAFCTFAGYGFARPESNWMHKNVKNFTYLYGRLPEGRRLFTDVFSTDYYPIENANDRVQKVSIENMCRAMDTIDRYNAGLAPLIACVETCDIQKSDTPCPTPEEIRVLCWANVIHGARGISWFHYFKPTPPENFAEMKRFKEQVTRLTPAVCGPKYKGLANVKSAGDGHVTMMATEADGSVYVFAANVRRKAATATFALPGKSGTVEVIDENRSLKLTNGSFGDQFKPLAVHIYRIGK